MFVVEPTTRQHKQAIFAALSYLELTRASRSKVERNVFSKPLTPPFTEYFVSIPFAIPSFFLKKIRDLYLSIN